MRDQDPHSIPVSLCPVCERSLDAAIGYPDNNVNPKIDDITICLYCHSVLSFNKDLTLREVTDLESSELSPESHMDIANLKKFLIREFKKEKNND